MTSRTDIQQHFGRVQVDSMRISGNPTSLGQAWVETTTPLRNGSLGVGGTALVRYTIVGKTCHAQYRISQSAAGVSAGNLGLEFPVPASSNDPVFAGNGGFLGATVGNAIVTAVSTGNNVFFNVVATAAAAPVLVGSSGFGLTNASWNLRLGITYEIA